MRSAVLGIALTVSLLAACVHVERYPDNWEPITAVPNHECPNLTGAFLNTGEIPSRKYTVSLAVWVFPDWDYSDKPKAVRFQLSEDVLVIRTVGGSQEKVLSLSRDSGEFGCSKGALQIHRHEGTNREGVVGFTSGTLELARTRGFLVMNSSGGGVGIGLLLPVAGYGNNYARFPVMNE